MKDFSCLDDLERSALAERLGYQTIGRVVPQEVTVRDVVRTFPKSVRLWILRPVHPMNTCCYPWSRGSKALQLVVQCRFVLFWPEIIDFKYRFNKHIVSIVCRLKTKQCSMLIESTFEWFQEEQETKSTPHILAAALQTLVAMVLNIVSIEI